MAAIIILAAGASSRMGSPKQLLAYGGNNLLQHAIHEALGTGFSPVMVVLGAKENEIVPVIKNDDILIVENAEWEEGLGSSVRAGISTLIKQTPEPDSVILMLCDQPFVTSTLLKQLVEIKAATNKNIVASMYRDTAGVPVLFDHSFFPELLLLRGQDGAKKLLLQYAEEVATILFPEGAVDIDTPEDYHTLVLNAGSI